MKRTHVRGKRISHNIRVHMQLAVIMKNMHSETKWLILDDINQQELSSR